jgi:hypothetical protein
MCDYTPPPPNFKVKPVNQFSRNFVDVMPLEAIPQTNFNLVQLGYDELASGDWREGEVLFPL